MAFDDDKIGGDILKRFKAVKKYFIGKRKNSNARKRVLSPSEFENLYNQMPGHGKGLLLKAYFTGMRYSEVTSLTWDMVSLKERKITLPKEITKDDEEREVPSGDELYSFLKAVPKAIHDKHVFLHKGRPVKDIRGSLKKACEDSGIVYGPFVKDGFIEHDLRITFITNMRKAGVHDDVTNSITGHSDPSMRARYDSVSFDDKKDGIAKLESYLRKASENVDKVLTKTSF